MSHIITAETLSNITAVDLHEAAAKALADGRTVEFFQVSFPARGERVETLVVDGDRAGQATNGSAVWGDWHEPTRTVLLDDTDGEGRALVASLDGRQTLRAEWEVEQAKTLDALYEALRAHGHEVEDWTSLNTFGGEEPRSTVGVWSWDAERLLVGESPRELSLVARAEWGSSQ